MLRNVVFFFFFFPLSLEITRILRGETIVGMSVVGQMSNIAGFCKKVKDVRILFWGS